MLILGHCNCFSHSNHSLNILFIFNGMPQKAEIFMISVGDELTAAVFAGCNKKCVFLSSELI